MILDVYPFCLNSTPLNLSLLPKPPFSCHPRRFTSPNSAPAYKNCFKNVFVSEEGCVRTQRSSWIRPCLHSATCATPGDPDWKESFTRAKHWWFDRHRGSDCFGIFTRWICNIGLGDLPWVISSPHMFVNKIRMEEDATAFRCLELWYRDRVQRRRPLANGNDTFDVSVYASQPFVRYHVSRTIITVLRG